MFHSAATFPETQSCKPVAIVSLFGKYPNELYPLVAIVHTFPGSIHLATSTEFNPPHFRCVLNLNINFHPWSFLQTTIETYVDSSLNGFTLGLFKSRVNFHLFSFSYISYHLFFRSYNMPTSSLQF